MTTRTKSRSKMTIEELKEEIIRAKEEALWNQAGFACTGKYKYKSTTRSQWKKYYALKRELAGRK